ncbi:xanthine dehydrogenase small subunit [Curvibacter sp. PAE-UM]|uniref:xanthine dehydrogenase small subunit n=1 Tax=Curvibacter sp. PAE-UM TaxID=1714344 RepID=UPI0007108173|nr:xanthine dehydrogenase small subunit [Curvibacter sp. PAE-UM]KRH98697.1 ferredoxin [Curvibacter sp. PAE-UM]
MNVRPLQFVRRGQLVSLENVAPSRTLLEVLREDLQCTAVKEGCGEGDCGACTVVLAEPAGEGLSYKAINSCIRLAHSVHGMAVWTAQDLPASDGALHPCQQAMVNCHGSQCGFCTPGFVMSLFGMYQNRVLAGETVSREDAQTDLSGNLCRCTGYRPILDAAQQMGALPRVPVDEAAVLAQLHQIAPAPAADYSAPTRLVDLLKLRAEQPQAQLVAGCTDVGLWVTKQHRQFAQVLDVTRVEELRQLSRTSDTLRIGAAVTLHEAYAALVADRPQLRRFAERFAGLPVRNSGTLGGNVANGSPIGDSMPLLLALGATLVLASVRGERRLPLDDFYTGYRKNLLAPDEVLAFIDVPLPVVDEHLRIYKISKRQDDDISAVCLALNLHVRAGRISSARIGAGGVAATPVRARKTEAALLGQPWALATFEAAAQVLQPEFEPISDMRASAAYRSSVLGRLLLRYWAEEQGELQLEALS